MSRNATAIMLAIGVVFFLLPGIAGVTVGGPSAQAGWWLIVVGVILVGATLYSRSRKTS